MPTRKQPRSKFEKRVPRIKIAVRLDPELLKNLREQSKTEDVSPTAYIEAALTHFMDVREFKIQKIKRGRFRETK
jgi:predicted transcriptional regulator